MLIAPSANDNSAVGGLVDLLAGSFMLDCDEDETEGDIYKSQHDYVRLVGRFHALKAHEPKGSKRCRVCRRARARRLPAHALACQRHADTAPTSRSRALRSERPSSGSAEVVWAIC